MTTTRWGRGASTAYSLTPPPLSLFLSHTLLLQPPLGWTQLQPLFCVHYVADATRLPTAATCFNMLKLPALASTRAMREKLLFSAKSGMGFELS